MMGVERTRVFMSEEKAQRIRGFFGGLKQEADAKAQDAADRISEEAERRARERAIETLEE
jgi:hypothetical protein